MKVIFAHLTRRLRRSRRRLYEAAAGVVDPPLTRALRLGRGAPPQSAGQRAALIGPAPALSHPIRGNIIEAGKDEGGAAVLVALALECQSDTRLHLVDSWSDFSAPDRTLRVERPHPRQPVDDHCAWEGARKAGDEFSRTSGVAVRRLPTAATLVLGRGR